MKTNNKISNFKLKVKRKPAYVVYDWLQGGCIRTYKRLGVAAGRNFDMSVVEQGPVCSIYSGGGDGKVVSCIFL